MSKNRKEYDKKYEEKRKEKRAGKRSRNWLVNFYPEDLPNDWVEQIDDLRVAFCLSPLHDKDINPDGTPKKAHHHSLWKFGNVMTFEQVKAIFGDLFGYGGDNGDSVIGVPDPIYCRDCVATVRYMAHLDHPDKAQYNVADIIGYNGFNVSKWLEKNEEETRQMMIDIQNFVFDNKIVEYCDLCDICGKCEDLHEWFTFITTKNTFWIVNLLRSYRNKTQTKENNRV